MVLVLNVCAVLGGIVALLALAALAYRGCVMFYQIHKLLDHELRPNGGGSMKDVTNRIDDRFDKVEERLTVLEEKK